MIDPVSNRGYYEYRKVNAQMNAGMETGEKFALNYDGKEKESDKKDEKKIEERDGVIAEFSGQSGNRQESVGAQRSSKEAQTKEQGLDIGQSVERAKGFIGKLTKVFSEFFAGIRQSLLAFWNSDSGAEKAEAEMPQEDMVEAMEETAGEAAEAADEMMSEAEAAQTESQMPQTVALPDPKSPDYVSQIENYLEQSGRNVYVKNSDLLTYYDRSGRIVQMNGADKNRILHGDRAANRYQ